MGKKSGKRNSIHIEGGTPSISALIPFPGIVMSGAQRFRHLAPSSSRSGRSPSRMFVVPGASPVEGECALSVGSPPSRFSASQ